jgi:23S rRNA (cytidine1920-2'-O)/16S rRNA (cytidine1409-2'-O)-methyltransferase
LTKPLRLDAELVRRGIVASRSEARRAIEQGRVVVGGMPVTRAATLVRSESPISLTGDAPRFVSRGGEKLDAALSRFDVKVEGKRWLDAGASTGGFTDCLLQRGAVAVAAVDVGYGQLAWRLRGDERVVVIERTNARHLRPGDLPWAPEGVTADLSFISLTNVLPALVAVVDDGADLVMLVKPQFEVGRAAVGKGGVVRDPELWLGAVRTVAGVAERLGFGVADAMCSPLTGPAGNREFFLHLKRGVVPNEPALTRAIEGAEGR